MKIAVIGSGIAGLTAAHLLSRQHVVEVFEKASHIGGHTATIPVETSAGTQGIDTGFIVFNDRTYPRFRQLLRELGVSWQDTEMSFSVQNPRTGLEYNGHNLRTLFAQKRNLFRPSFYRLLREIVRFNNTAKARLDQAGAELDTLTLSDFVAAEGFSTDLQENYLYPMCAAIWSASLAEASEFPLGFFLRFFLHHGLLDLKNRPQWHVVQGGSASYLAPLTAPFRDSIHCNAGLRQIWRSAKGVELEFASGARQTFDEVVLACHSDQALALLGDPSASEREVLGAIPYQPNEVVLHRDTRLLPRARQAWASWNYLLPATAAGHQQPASVTYNMNILQGLELPETYCVTLNNTAAIAPDKIIQQFTYDHPVYSVAGFQARQRRSEICGQQHTHFCGAYWYSGFHEDGVRSAYDVAARLGVTELPAERSVPEQGV